METELCAVQHLLLHITTIVIKLAVSVTLPLHRTERYETVSDRYQTPIGSRKKTPFNTSTKSHHSYTAVYKHSGTSCEMLRYRWAIYIDSPRLNTSDVTHKPRSDAPCLTCQASVFCNGQQMSGLRIRTRTTHLQCQSVRHRTRLWTASSWSRQPTHAAEHRIGTTNQGYQPHDRDITSLFPAICLAWYVIDCTLPYQLLRTGDVALSLKAERCDQFRIVWS
jgi:hypothetical protein